AFAHLAGSDGVWETVNLFAGLADTAHTVTIKDTGSNAGTNTFYIDTTTSLSLTGAAPAFALPTGFGQVSAFKDAATQLLVETEGFWSSIVTGGNASVQSAIYPDGEKRMRAKCTFVKLWCFLN